jgi:hypothetical protein
MAKNTVEMTKAAITEVTHDPLKGEELAPPSSACTGLLTAALPNAAGAVGLAEAGFVRKVLPTKVLSSTNMEFEGDLVGGMEGGRDDAFVAVRMWSAEPGRRFTIAIVAAEAIVVPTDNDRLGRSPSAPPSRSVSQ